MKSHIKFVFCIFLILILAPFGQGQGFVPVYPGTQYIHQRIGDKPWSIHVVKARRNRRDFRLVSSLSQGTIRGLSPVSKQTEEVCLMDAEAVAGINGDFFRIRPGPYQGDPLGLQIAGGQLVSAPIGVSFWIDSARQPHIGDVFCKFRCSVPGGVSFGFALNEERADDAAVLYTPAFGPSTHTHRGCEFVLRKSEDSRWLPLRPGLSYTAQIARRNDHGDTNLSADTMVLSIGPELMEELPSLDGAATVTLSLDTSPDLTGVRTAIGGGPILLKAGTPRKWKPEKPRHPRTALGWNEEFFFLIVVDGRQAGLSVGMSYPELAALLKRLGCREGMNMDGGGSSTLWLGGEVMNSPSDGRERPVANALLLVRERSSHGP